MVSLAALALCLQADAFAIHAGKVVSCRRGEEAQDNAVVVVRDGRIDSVVSADQWEAPEGMAQVDARDQWLVPGLVDLHCHVGTGGPADLNDTINPTNPGLRVWDQVDPDNPFLRTALAGGVTTVLYIPGSGSNMGGFGTLMKTAGESIDDMTLRTDGRGLPSPGGLKIAQAGNPERSDGNIGAGRMGMNWGLRRTLERGRDYARSWADWEEDRIGTPPVFNPDLDYFRGLFKGEFPCAVHSQIFQVVQMTARMLHDEFGLKVVLDHSTFDGWKNAPLYAERGIPVIHGPRVYDPFALSREGRFIGTAHEWHQGGVEEIGLNTDSVPLSLAMGMMALLPPQEGLHLQGAMAARWGMDPLVALRAVTDVPARAIGAGDRIGSIAPGLDADLVLFSGDPLDPRSRVLRTWIEGRLVYDATDGRRVY